MAKKKKAAPTTRWEILAGDFTDENGVKVSYERGKRTFFESSLPLDQVPFGPEKFRRVEEAQAGGETDEGTQALEAEEDATPESSQATAEPEGEDVTEDFPTAEKAALKVYHKDGNYYVYDANNLSTPLHDEDLTSKTKVKAKIAEFGAE
jgi:hypothetical protein